MAPSTVGHRAFANLRLLSLSLLLGVGIYGVIKTAVEGVWVICAFVSGCSLVVLMLMWATQRQVSYGPRDRLAILLLLGAAAFFILILAAMSRA
jgi:hypothetical protein